MRTFDRFVGDAYMRPVRFTRWVALSVWLQRAAYMPPLRMTRYFCVTVMSRAGFPRRKSHPLLPYSNRNNSRWLSMANILSRVMTAAEATLSVSTLLPCPASSR